MKKYIFKSLSALALTFSLGMTTSCVGDLDQIPKDPNILTSANFTEEDVRMALAKYLADKYNGLYIDIDDYANNSIKAKIEAFLRLR